MGTTVQLNTRIDKALKLAGDQALADVGVSPSKLIRQVWHVAAERGDRLQQLLRVLGSTSPMRAASQSDTSTPTITSEPSAAPQARGKELYEQALQTLDLHHTDIAHTTGHADWKSVREEAIASRLIERGVL